MDCNGNRVVVIDEYGLIRAWSITPVEWMEAIARAYSEMYDVLPSVGNTYEIEGWNVIAARSVSEETARQVMKTDRWY